MGIGLTGHGEERGAARSKVDGDEPVVEGMGAAVPMVQKYSGGGKARACAGDGNTPRFVGPVEEGEVLGDPRILHGPFILVTDLKNLGKAFARQGVVVKTVYPVAAISMGQQAVEDGKLLVTVVFQFSADFQDALGYKTPVETETLLVLRDVVEAGAVHVQQQGLFSFDQERRQGTATGADLFVPAALVNIESRAIAVCMETWVGIARTEGNAGHEEAVVPNAVSYFAEREVPPLEPATLPKAAFLQQEPLGHEVVFDAFVTPFLEKCIEDVQIEFTGGRNGEVEKTAFPDERSGTFGVAQQPFRFFPGQVGIQVDHGGEPDAGFQAQDADLLREGLHTARELLFVVTLDRSRVEGTDARIAIVTLGLEPVVDEEVSAVRDLFPEGGARVSVY